MSNDLTHVDAEGRVRMVDVSGKEVTAREAVASARVRMAPETLEVLVGRTAKKGDVLATARIAGIQAAKRTPELIPLCHQIALSSVEVRFTIAPETVQIEARARARDQTGVEMEALTAAAVAALTIYDMLKAIDRGMVIEAVQLESKTGGSRGDYRRA
ncbi:MAG TPA: cyclic pyranopterin monophosphate synthase MoaC [Polyangiaceae bacterium]|nr:cyclic pyranopterin monophosphate synthase MoaC [Polyangiaceae bacterium]